jgi:transposase
MSKTRQEKKSDQIEITVKDGEELFERLESKALIEQDYEILKWFLRTFFKLHWLLEKKNTSINRLKRLFFIKTEKTKAVVKESESATEEKTAALGEESNASPPSPPPENKKQKGHGKNGASAYKGLEQKKVPHGDLRVGSLCPGCGKGKLYKLKPCKKVRLISHPPVTGAVYELERLRCASCSEVFKAPLPAEAGKEKYSEETGSMLALLKYGNGFAFNRLENFQNNFAIPLPASTIWDIIEKTANRIYPVHIELMRLAGQGKVIYNDDTGVKILSHLKAKKAGGSRKGTFTTGIISIVEGREIVLYFSGTNHAGENLARVLKKRAKNLGPPVQMCDGLSRNLAKGVLTYLVNCLSHGRRKFVEIYELFEPQCRIVLESLREVYRNDALAKEKKWSPAQRLVFHQENSKPVMDKLKTWMDKQIEENLVEPNSSLGEAINYMRKRWNQLTGFLHIEGAPLDNNITERALKKAILNRKNSYFFKNEFGAHIGDIFISIIQTCIQAKVNLFEYLTLLQKNTKRVFQEPKDWLPWNYKETLAALNSN